jgi:hypothetical protein
MAGAPFNQHTRRPLFNPRTLETRLPGVFLCGTIVLKWKGEKANKKPDSDSYCRKSGKKWPYSAYMPPQALFLG